MGLLVLIAGYKKTKRGMIDFYKDITTGKEILVVSYDELVPKFYKTEQSLRAVVSRDSKRGFGIRKIRQGKGQGHFALVEFDSLPLEIQEQMNDPRRDKHPIEMFYRHAVEAERFFANYFLPDGRRIPADIRAKYTANVGTIQAVLKLKESRECNFARCGKRVPKMWEHLCKDAVSFKSIQEKIDGTAHNLPENHRRFQEKIDKYSKADSSEAAYETIITDYHVSNSTFGARKVHKNEIDLFESIFRGIGYKPNYKDVYDVYMDFLFGKKEIISNTTGEILKPSDFVTVSESTIRMYLSKWESKIATLRLRTGDRQKLLAEVTPYHSMDMPEYAGSLLSIDDRKPPFEYAEGARVWFYLGYDCGADCYTTIVWGKTKEGIILDFYRQMVRNYAEWGLSLPYELECESNLNAGFKKTFLQDGNMFQYVRMEANRARGKIIENKNGAMRYGDERKTSGWIARPFAKSESNREGIEKVPMIPYETIVEQELQLYEKWNNQPHPICKNMTRWDFFMSRQHKDLKPINWMGIIPYIGFETKSSCHTGIVRLNRGECLLGINGQVALGDNLIKLMKLVEGQELNVKWLDGNDGRVLKAFAYIGENYICELVQKPTYARARLEQTEQDIKNRELMSKYVSTVEGFGNRRKKEIEKVTVLENTECNNLQFKHDHHFTIPQLELLHKRERVKAKQQTEVEVLTDIESNINNNGMVIKPTLIDRY